MNSPHGAFNGTTFCSTTAVSLASAHDKVLDSAIVKMMASSFDSRQVAIFRNTRSKAELGGRSMMLVIMARLYTFGHTRALLWMFRENQSKLNSATMRFKS
jgi:predicted thioredoxin/glutaredoxin